MCLGALFGLWIKPGAHGARWLAACMRSRVGPQPGCLCTEHGINTYPAQRGADLRLISSAGSSGAVPWWCCTGGTTLCLCCIEMHSVPEHALPPRAVPMASVPSSSGGEQLEDSCSLELPWLAAPVRTLSAF